MQPLTQLANGTRVTIARTTPRHEVGVLLATDEKRAVVATTYLNSRGEPRRWIFARPLADIGPCEEH